MKRMTVEDLAEHLDEFVGAPPGERVLLTKNGKPFAFISDASTFDDEDIAYMTDPEFWKMIRERRRKKGGVRLEDVMARIEREEGEERALSADPGSNGRNEKDLK